MRLSLCSSKRLAVKNGIFTKFTNFQRFQSSSQAKNEVVIGIDLGTTNSAVAIMEGKIPRIIENSEGARTTPSIVAFTKEKNLNNILVGNPAKRQAVINHENTFYATKRLIGRKFSDDEVQKDLSTVPYKIVEHDNGDAWLQTSFGTTHSPSEIGGLVLKEMKLIATKYLDRDITNAVVTVPAYFNDSQRQATKTAGEIVGLNVLRVINEPTAASLAYGLDKKNEGIVAVYDLGGGTFDISILDIEDGVFQVRSTNGDTHLGGEDFDNLVSNHILEIFKNKTGIDLKNDRLAIQRVRQAAEKAKIDLTHVKKTRIELPFLTKTESLALELTEDQLDEMSLPLIKRTIDPVRKALKDADLTKQDIDDVILVGGMTRMPKIIKTVENFFGKKPNTSVNPDEAVALGAAIQGAVLVGEVKNVLLLDVTPLTLGIETFGGIFSPLIPRNTTVPCKVKQLYSTAVDGQNAINVNVYQGERSLVQDNKLIGEFKLSDIPPMPKGAPKIEVSFEIDADGIIKVSARDQTSGKESSITVSGSTGLTEDEVKKMVNESKLNSTKDQARRNVFTKLNNLELICFDTEQALNQWGVFVTKEEKEGLLAHIQDLKKLISDARNDESFEDINLIEKAQEELKDKTLKVIEKAGVRSRDAKKNAK
ncbi:hypothetical protein PACTADRAFT_42747 [Pachysolen tannophilus NRRL Y-2460]|uniref:Heat shock protein SSC1, mitochondrial n=1 Tax=Pachysolen tannophilus NRRL Y-2460 TaxID=669874 RepID=A0A1E4TU39_PACTA|nr:hypothetical protein PACTADRAFT_42747 [Pachysolen tannophilus NRRL Y-2460]